jgi:hypothetical protein
VGGAILPPGARRSGAQGGCGLALRCPTSAAPYCCRVRHSQTDRPRAPSAPVPTARPPARTAQRLADDNVDLLQPHLELLERFAGPGLGPLQLPPAWLGLVLVALLSAAATAPHSPSVRWYLLRSVSALLRGTEPVARGQLVLQRVLAAPGLQPALEGGVSAAGQLLRIGMPWAASQAAGLAELQLLVLVAQQRPGAWRCARGRLLL